MVKESKESKKNDLDAELRELKVKVQNEKIVVGGERVLKLLQGKGLEKVFVSKNCPAKLRSDVMHYAHLTQTPTLELEQTNEELGIFCKKNFFVSVLGTRSA